MFYQLAYNLAQLLWDLFSFKIYNYSVLFHQLKLIKLQMKNNKSCFHG